MKVRPRPGTTWAMYDERNLLTSAAGQQNVCSNFQSAEVNAKHGNGPIASALRTKKGQHSSGRCV